MGKLIIVDDDEEIRVLLSRYLEKNGYQAQTYESGEEFLAQGAGDAQLVILDIGLPGIDGLEVCRRIRQHSTLPIIMLTATADDVDRILGLELGADDYMGKPFNPRELLARIKALLRRVPQQAEPVNASHLSVDLNTRHVSYDNRSIPLTGAEFDLLTLLEARQGQIVSREELCMELKGRPLNPNDRSLDTLVSRLRVKLETASGNNLIMTIRGKGYQLVVQ